MTGRDRVAGGSSDAAMRVWQGDGVAATLLRLLLVLTAANAIFNTLAVQIGLGGPAANFLGDPSDRFGDFFKLALSYPGGSAMDLGWLPHGDALRAAYRLSAYHGHDPALVPPHTIPAGLSHFHITPLSTLLTLLSVAAMGWINAVLLFLLLIAALAAYAWRVAMLAATGRGERIAWWAAILCSYPMLMAVTRGNLLAGITGLLVLHALLIALRGGSAAMTGLLLGVALNIRPNAVLFVLPAMALIGATRWRFAWMAAGSTAAIFGAALGCDGLLYPPYRLVSFLAGLGEYYDFYVYGNFGAAYGSSLYGALKALLGFRPALDVAAEVVALALLAAGLALHAAGRIDRALLLFLSCAAYCLGSTILGDYHLIVFLIVPMALARDGVSVRRPAIASGMAAAGPWLAFLVCALLLAPKNYIFSGGVSWQVLLNPLLLLGASLPIVAEAMPPLRLPGRAAV